MAIFAPFVPVASACCTCVSGLLSLLLQRPRALAIRTACCSDVSTSPLEKMILLADSSVPLAVGRLSEAATRQAHPGFQSRRGLRKVAAALTEQRRKGIGQLTGAGHRGCDLSEMTKEGSFLCLELVRRRAEEAGAEPGRGHGPYCGLSF